MRKTQATIRLLSFKEHRLGNPLIRLCQPEKRRTVRVAFKKVEKEERIVRRTGSGGRISFRLGNVLARSSPIVARAWPGFARLWLGLARFGPIVAR